ncbi:MAG: AI-2E family transporter [Candidatus Paceibacterota bacterium]
MIQKNAPTWLWRWTTYATLLLWLSVGIVNSIKVLNGFILLLLLSFLAACALEQPVNYLQKRGLRRSIATLATIFIASCSVMSILILGGAVIISQVSSLKKSAPSIAAELASWAGSLGYKINPEDVSTQVTNWLSSALQENAANLLTTSTMVIANIAIAVLITYYLVADGPRLRRNICSLLPQNKQQRVLDVWVAAIDKAGGYFISRALLAVLAITTSYIFFIIIGLQYSLALALWVGFISQLIPALGTYIAGALPILVAVQNSPTTMVLVALFLLLYQQIENYILAPKISKKVMQIHPAIAFISAIVGALLSGFVGALIAIPLVATAQAVISASIERHELIENDLLKQPKTTKREKRKKINKKVIRATKVNKT